MSGQVSLEETVAWMITSGLAGNASRFPEWMQVPALGRSMKPLGDLAAPVVAEFLRGVLAGVVERLKQAEVDVAGDGPLEAWERGYVAATAVAVRYLEEAGQ